MISSKKGLENSYWCHLRNKNPLGNSEKCTKAPQKIKVQYPLEKFINTPVWFNIAGKLRWFEIKKNTSVFCLDNPKHASILPWVEEKLEFHLWPKNPTGQSSSFFQDVILSTKEDFLPQAFFSVNVLFGKKLPGSFP